MSLNHKIDILNKLDIFGAINLYQELARRMTLMQENEKHELDY